ncbi:MAG: glycosyltransferase family 4 protein [Deltaproteobacteria bacterium]|nr:glycosyltransferase family 4 protein [Deltaproteobacteria bacterium]
MKYAEGLTGKYDDVQLFFAYMGLTLTELYGHGDELFKQWFKIAPDPATQLQEIVNTYPIDLVHSHNAPDSLTRLFIDLFGGRIPIVHDIHDLLSIRRTPYQDGFNNRMSDEQIIEEEKSSIECSHAVIVVSDEILRITSQAYQMPETTLVFPNYIPRRFVPQKLPEKSDAGPDRIRMVYQGFLSNNNSHYDLSDIFAAIGKTGIEVNIYPSRDNPTYREFASDHPHIIYHNHLSPEALFPELTQYDFGWAGFNQTLNRRHIDTVLPNKCFEYIACGLPVVTFPHKSLKALLSAHNLGIIIEDVSKLWPALHDDGIELLRQNVIKKRHDFTVEAHIHKVRQLYEQVIAA